MTSETTPEPREISTIVGELAGAASMCWENIDKAGEFDSTQASKHVDAALAEIAALQAKPEGTTELELHFNGIHRDDVTGDVKITATYPANKGMLAIVALSQAGGDRMSAQLASALKTDHSVAEALGAAGLVLVDGEDD